MVSAYTQNAPKPSAKPRAKSSLFKMARPQISLVNLHEGYYRSCLDAGIRASSVKSYKAQLHIWELWCEKRGIALVENLTTALCVAFLKEQRAAGLSDRTVRARAVTIKAALKFAHKEGYIASEKLYGYEIPKAAQPVVYMASTREMDIIMRGIKSHWSAATNPASRFRNPDARRFFARRDQAILAVALSVGLRISETLALTLSDYSTERRELTVRHSKTGRPRSVPVTEHLAGFLADWLTTRPQAAPSDFLFVTEFGLQLQGMAWSRQFQRYLTYIRKAGTPLPRITLSSIRHIAATALAEAGGVYHASLLLGHSSTKVTEASYIHRNTEIIRKTHEAADPLAGILTNTRSAERRRRII